MTREELLALIAEVQDPQSELTDVEVKAARGGTPQRLYEPLSAFANRTGGGVVLCGLDEREGFAIVGVGDPHRLQENVSNLASDQMEPALRPEFTVEQVEGHMVVAIEVHEVPPEQRPCHYEPAGLQKGSWIRVGNTNRRMTDYEIFGYVSARSQPTFDEEAVPEATLGHLDREQLQAFVTQLQRSRPEAAYLREPVEKVLQRLRIVRDVNGTLRPTLTGLLVFGAYPHEFMPQLVITFIQYYGTSETERGPRGERFMDDRKFEGPIPDIVQGAVNYVMASIRKSPLVEGLFRRDILEYPEEAVREAVVNAVAHRDYSHFVRGNQIQIRLFADRLEIRSPGGLYGNVTVETLEQAQSTRNSALMRVLEHLRVDERYLAENRGSGVSAMIRAMRDANLEPPRFDDRRRSFVVTFHSHTLMNPEAIAWLNQFANKPLNDGQRVALAYLRRNHSMTNSDYQRLSHVDSVTATHELRGLVQARLIEQHSTRGGAYYTLSVPAEVEVEVTPPAQTDEEKILAYVRKHGSISNEECRGLLHVNRRRAIYLFRRLRKRGLLRPKDKSRGRWVRYVLP